MLMPCKQEINSFHFMTNPIRLVLSCLVLRFPACFKVPLKTAMVSKDQYIRLFLFMYVIDPFFRGLKCILKF
ncbi:hypothetical protein AYJ66_17235 [Dietzia cinnamea]|nr:hypothetical protein AYJ66_17235 [Dietzia cinnamea]